MARDPSDSELPFWLKPWAIVAFVAAMLLTRFYVASATGLVRDEGYYTYWSFVPATGYLDHPPMVAWAIAAGRAVLGDGEGGVRLFMVLSIAIASLAVYRTGRLLFDARTAGIAVIWYNLTVAAALLFIAAPDAPSVMFWTLAVWAVAEFASGRNANWWLAVGLFVGLGLLSKYTGFFLGVGLLLFLITSRERWNWFKLWQLWAGGVLSLFVFLPNLLWNLENDWGSFAFQGRRLDVYGINYGSFLNNFGDLVAGQAAATGFFLFVLALIGCVLFFTRRGAAALALPIFTALPMLLYFTLYTVRFRVEANWLVPIWPTLSLVAAWTAVHLRPRNRLAAIPLAAMRWLQAPLGLVLVGLIYAQALLQPFALPQAIDRTRDMRGWEGAFTEVAALAAANSAQWVAVGGDYGLTGELAAYGRFAGSELVVRQTDEPERYGFLPPMPPELLAGSAVYVGSSPTAYFETARLIGEARRMQGDEVLERFEVHLVSMPKPAVIAALTGE